MILGTRSPFLRKSQLHMNVKEKRVTREGDSMIDQEGMDLALMMAKEDSTMVLREEEEEDLMTEGEDLDTMMTPM